MHDVKATSLGVDKARFKAEIDFDGYVITQRYLREDDRLSHMFDVIFERLSISSILGSETH